MRSLECRFTRQQIDELELGERPSERATAHLSLCAACRDFRAERNELRQLVGSLEPVVAPADFEMRLRGEISKHNIEGSIGSGGPLIDLSTSNGSIRILK